MKYVHPVMLLVHGNLTPSLSQLTEKTASQVWSCISGRQTRCIYAVEEPIHFSRLLQTSTENRFHTDDL